MDRKWIVVILAVAVGLALWGKLGQGGFLVNPEIEAPVAAGTPEGSATGPIGREQLEEGAAPPAGAAREPISRSLEAPPGLGFGLASGEEDAEPDDLDSDRRDHFTGQLKRLGAGVPGARVLLQRSGEVVERRMTDAEGTFTISRSSRRGMQRLSIEWGELTLRVPPSRMRFGRSEPAIYCVGTGTVTIRVWAKGGVPKADAMVVLSVAETKGRARYDQRKLSGPDGTAVFHAVPSGPVMAQAASSAPNSVTGALAEEGAQITLDVGPAPDAAVLAVEVKLADGRPSSTRYRMAVEGLGPLAGKRYSLECYFLPGGRYTTDIPPGRYRLTTVPALLGTPREVYLADGMGPIELIAGGAVIRGMLLGRDPSWPDPETGLGSEYGDSPREAWLLDEATEECVATGRIRDSGRFEILGVEPGHYVLTGNKSRIDPDITEVPMQVNSALEVIEATLEIVD